MTTCPDCQQTWDADGTLGPITPFTWCSACKQRATALRIASYFKPPRIFEVDYAAIEKSVFANFKAMPLRGGQPLRGRNAFTAMLDDYAFVAPRTGRFRSDVPNYGSLPMHEHRGRMQCRVEVGIPLQQCGRHWRMARRNTADTFSMADGTACASFLGLDRRPFASREAALKYVRRLWKKARVELASYGLKVTIYVPDFHLIRAVHDRSTRARAKLNNFSTLYTPPKSQDHIDAVAGALAMLHLTSVPSPVSK